MHLVNQVELFEIEIHVVKSLTEVLIIERYLVIKLEIDERGSGFGLLLDLNLMQKKCFSKSS